LEISACNELSEQDRIAAATDSAVLLGKLHAKA
jgi:hypothetical protein